MNHFDAWTAVVLGGFASTAVMLWMLGAYVVGLGRRISSQEVWFEDMTKAQVRRGARLEKLSTDWQFLAARIERAEAFVRDLEDASCCSTLELHRLDARLDAVEAMARGDRFHE